LAAYRFQGAKLRAAREAAGLTREQLADSIGRSESLIKLVELGHCGTRPEKLAELAVVLGVPMESFFVAGDDTAEALA
jgi:transcriptional regulator with XRE-family HTH domain